MPEPLIGLHSTKQTNRSSETGCGTRAESRMAKHRQTQLEEVHYEITVGIESWRILPPPFGISTFRAPCGRYVRCTNSSPSWSRNASTPPASTASNVTRQCPELRHLPWLADRLRAESLVYRRAHTNPKSA